MKLEFFDIFSKSSHITIFMKSVQWEPSWPCEQTDSQTDREAWRS